MKKWLVFILLIITAASTFIPCCQDDCCAEELSPSSAGHEHKETGNCSPFFSCPTCPGFTQIVNFALVGQPVNGKIRHQEAILIFTLPAYAGSFWQPPRITC